MDLSCDQTKGVNMKKLILFITISLWWTCDTPTIPQESNEPKIIDTFIDYDVVQDSIQLFIQVEAEDEQGLDSIDSVIVVLKLQSDYYVNFEQTFVLNDLGENGDILPNNGVYSVVTNIIMLYGKFRMTSSIVDIEGNSTTTIKYIYIEEKFPPEIEDVDMLDVFVLDLTETTFLDISLSVKDLNGVEDIKNVLYSINTDFMYQNISSTSDCEFVISDDQSENNYYHDISWYLEYSESENDSVFVYSTSIPMRPVNECGGYGIALFKFTVRDYEGDADEYETVLEIIKCGDDICQDEYEDSNTCPEDCQ